MGMRRIKTYGEHAENAARALNSLITADAIPTDEAAVDQMLHCREAVVDALRQRLYDLGQHDWYPPTDHLPASVPSLTLAGMNQRLASLVDNIAFALPALPLDERRSPAEYLGPASDDPVVESWREAGIELLSATHALAGAQDRPWLSDPGAGWWVMRDIAVALEAVLVLDARLEEVMVLSDLKHPDFAMSLDEKRMVLSQTARMATWHATSASPDLAAPQMVTKLGPSQGATVVMPLTAVAAPEDLVAGQRRLSRFLLPTTGPDIEFGLEEPDISADCARQVTASQLFLCRAFAEAAASSPETRSLAGFFEERAEVLDGLQPQLAYLVDASNGPEPSMRSLWQQSELTSAVLRMQDQGTPIELEPAQMVELAKATHEVTHNLGACLRHELLRNTGNLLDAHPRHGQDPIRPGRYSLLAKTTTDLVNLPAPAEPVTKFSNPLQRAALRRALDITPTFGPPPAPFPEARSTDYAPAPTY